MYYIKRSSQRIEDGCGKDTNLILEYLAFNDQMSAIVGLYGVMIQCLEKSWKVTKMTYKGFSCIKDNCVLVFQIYEGKDHTISVYVEND